MSRAFFNRFNSRSSGSADPIKGWLEQDPHNLMQTAQRYMALEQLIQSYLPKGLQRCQVAQIDRQTLTLAVPSAAHATKLRQLTPRLIQQLQHHHWQLTQIHIQIQSVLISREKTPGEKQQGGAGISQSGVLAFESLADDENNKGPLQAAIKRLIQRHK